MNGWFIEREDERVERSGRDIGTEAGKRGDIITQVISRRGGRGCVSSRRYEVKSQMRRDI
jgi:hypothetical protein